MAKIFQCLKFRCTFYHAFERRHLTNPKESTAIITSSQTVFYNQYVCFSFVRLMNKMLTGILRLIATSYANLTWGPGQSDKKSSDNVFFFFFFFLVLSLFNSRQMVNFKEIYHFSRFQRGSNIFQGGPTFSRGGVQLLIPYRNPI